MAATKQGGRRPQTYFSLSPEETDQLAELAEQTGRSVSSIVAGWVSRGLAGAYADAELSPADKVLAEQIADIAAKLSPAGRALAIKEVTRAAQHAGRMGAGTFRVLGTELTQESAKVALTLLEATSERTAPRAPDRDPFKTSSVRP